MQRKTGQKKNSGMSMLKGFIQQYGAVVESLVHAFLSFAPVAAGTEDKEAEQTIQLIQSISDAVALRRDKFMVSTSNSRSDGIRFVLRVVKCFQLWCELKSSNPRTFALRLEMVRLSLSLVLLRLPNSGRLPETEIFELPDHLDASYVGTRTGTKLKSLSALFPSDCNTQLSDFLHAIGPLVYLVSAGDGGWTNARWTSWFLAIGLEYASILALPECRETEKNMRVKKLIVDSLVRQPMFSLVIEKPVAGVSNFWNKIPLLRDFNYLEYYLHMHKKYFYFHQ